MTNFFPFCIYPLIKRLAYLNINFILQADNSYFLLSQEYFLKNFVNE